MTTEIIDSRCLEEAAQTVKCFLKPSPLIQSRRLSEKLETPVYLKLESLQPTHSFKVRGALNAISSIEESVRKRGVVTASGGNHGLGVTLASNLLDTSALVYLPLSTPELKLNALKKLGAEVILEGEAWDEANQKALSVAESRGLSYIHPFNDDKVMAGQGSLVKEIVDEGLKPDLIVASIGGGGLISGIISAAHHFSPTSRVAGVETEGADCMSRSVEKDEIIELDAISSIAESLGAKKTEARPFNIVKNNIASLAVVEDKSAVQAALELIDQDKLLAEPAASCCIAALLEGKLDFKKGEKIVIVICGANTSLAKLQSY